MLRVGKKEPKKEKYLIIWKGEKKKLYNSPET